MDWLENQKLLELLGSPILSCVLPPGTILDPHGDEPRKIPLLVLSV